MLTKAVYPIIGKQSELPIYLTGIGVSDPEISVIRETGLSSHQFLYTSKGEGVLYVDGKEYPQQKNSVFYLAPGIPHEYRPIGEEWTTNWLVFRGKYASGILTDMGFDKFVSKSCCELSRCEKIFQRIFSASEDPISGGENSSVLVYEYILAMREAFFLHSKEGETKSRIVNEALLYIGKNYMEDITLERLSELSGISTQHFCRVFKGEMQMRPLEYIARRRISEAKALLSDTALDIGEIGRRVGYPDRNYFSMVFRRLEGASPREYRRAKGSSLIL